VSIPVQDVQHFLFGDPVPTDDPNLSVEWVKLSQWTDTQQVIVLALVVTVIILTLWNLRLVKGIWGRLAILGLRVAGLAVLVYAFYQPAQLIEKRARSTNNVIILIDDSRSMNLPHKEGTRREMVERFMSDNAGLFKQLERTSVIDVYRFSDTLTGMDWRQVGQSLTASGTHTHLLEVLQQLHERYRNRDVSGILILSDGIDNGRANRILSHGNQLDRESMRLLKSFKAPIHTFGLSDSSVQDVNIHELRYSPFAFKRNRSTLEADIDVHGYKKGTIEVELLEEGKLVRSVSRTIQPGVKRYKALFEFTPVELGFRIYTVRVKPFSNEVTVENNERHAVIRVSRDKIRVLQIAGHPSWDVRYLRNHLKKTPNIQLISFFILINTGSTLGIIDARETALIPFPAEELFVKELGGFDLVVLQDFNYGPFSTPRHLHRIRDYVRDGGALLLVGGRLALTAGGYDGTELAEVLPVNLTPTNFSDKMLDTGEFPIVLTKEGKTHAVTQLAYDPVANERIWKTLPDLEGINKTVGLANGGIALARHPTLKTPENRGMPVISVGMPGTGRVSVVATDSLWRWKLPNVGIGGDSRHYDKFWSNLIRWLIKDPDLDLVHVTPSNGVLSLGENVDLEVRVSTPDYRPSPNHAFNIRVVRRPRSGQSEMEEVEYEKRSAKTDEGGRWTVRRTPNTPGIYDVSVETTIAGRQFTASTVFVTSDERPEMRRVVGTDDVLKVMSRVTKGSSNTLSARNPSLRLNPPRVSQVTSRMYYERWNLPIVFIALCFFLGFEWWLRRRLGLV
jgi:uncharacterized membrane protein